MRKFVAGVGVATALMVGGLLGVAPAVASTYNFSYSGDGVSGSGTFTTSGASSPYDVTGISGTSNGAAITGLSSYAGADNLLYFPASYNDPTSPPSFLVDFAGIAWTVAGDAWGIANDGHGGYNIDQFSINPAGNCCGVDLINFDVSETPLPSTWTMLIAAFVGFGFLAHRSAKKGSAALAAA